MSNWHDIWQRRKLDPSADPAAITLRRLMDLDGYDHGPGSMSEADFRRFAAGVATTLSVPHGSTVLEVGCGAGAVLWCLREQGLRLAGIDYASELVAASRRILPEADLRVGEACSLPFDDASFDGAFSTGVFHYFPDLDYARRVLCEMKRVTRSSGRLLILDLPDAAKQAESDAVRSALGAHPDPKHLYYPKSFFADCAAELGMKAVLEDQSIPSYANARFRFNALLLPHPDHDEAREA